MRRITLWVLSTISTWCCSSAIPHEHQLHRPRRPRITAPQSTTATGSMATGSSRRPDGSANGTTAKGDRATPAAATGSGDQPPREPPQPPRPSMASGCSTRFGNVQVQITVENGQINQVRRPPGAVEQTRRTSRSSPGPCRPQIARGAVKAQSADIDMVSGATGTSEATPQSCSRPSTGRTCHDHLEIPVRPHTTTGVTPTLGRKAFVEQGDGMPVSFTSARPSRPCADTAAAAAASPTSRRWSRCSPPGRTDLHLPAPARTATTDELHPGPGRCHPRSCPEAEGPHRRPLQRLASPPGWTDRFDPTGWSRAGPSPPAAPPETVPEIAVGRSMPAADIVAGTGRGMHDVAPWRVGDRYRVRGQIAEVVTLTRGGMATSGAAIRGAQRVDPRTGSCRGLARIGHGGVGPGPAVGPTSGDRRLGRP